MGAWGHGLYDNDTAMDCADDYDDYLKQGKSKEEALSELKDSWYMTDNNSILVVADLQIKNFGKLDDDIKLLVAKAIQEEKENMSQWRNPEERGKVINDFYNSVKLLL